MTGLLKDTYKLRLSKQPESAVNITLQSIPTASEYFANSTSLRSGRDFFQKAPGILAALDGFERGKNYNFNARKQWRKG